MAAVCQQLSVLELYVKPLKAAKLRKNQECFVNEWSWQVGHEDVDSSNKNEMYSYSLMCMSVWHRCNKITRWKVNIFT